MTKWLKIAGVAGALLLAATFILGGSTLAFAANVWQGGAPFMGRGGFDGPGGNRHMDAAMRGEMGDFMGRPGFEGRGGPGGRDGHRGPRGAAAVGEVTAIEGGTLTVDPFWGETDITVQTDAATTYRTRTGDELTFEDISVGSWVMAKGQPVDGAENTLLAEVIGIKE
ncbi:MAG: hypothetical protein Kow0031_20910 [Anaerolineae bacterium]